jgi:branched-chain amino acid aminotransferase
MRVFLNGRFVPEEQASVSVFDRGFLYGDGLFETMRVLHGHPFRWEQHLDRLERGAHFLRLPVPYLPEQLRQFASQLLSEHPGFDGLLRLTVSRGVGRRGYSPAGADHPTVVMALHPLAVAPASGRAPRWKLRAASIRLPAGEPLAQFKTCNKLAQILARAEADAAEADEALLLNTDGFVVEGATSNLFWVEDGRICTPPLASGILAGVTRSVVMELCRSQGIPAMEQNTTIKDLQACQGVFLSLSSYGVVAADSLDGVGLCQSELPLKLAELYEELLRNECGK